MIWILETIRRLLSPRVQSCEAVYQPQKLSAETARKLLVLHVSNATMVRR
jgi:hypothetical protein